MPTRPLGWPAAAEQSMQTRSATPPVSREQPPRPSHRAHTAQVLVNPRPAHERGVTRHRDRRGVSRNNHRPQAARPHQARRRRPKLTPDPQQNPRPAHERGVTRHRDRRGVSRNNHRPQAARPHQARRRRPKLTPDPQQVVHVLLDHGCEQIVRGRRDLPCRRAVRNPARIPGGPKARRVHTGMGKQVAPAIAPRRGGPAIIDLHHRERGQVHEPVHKIHIAIASTPAWASR